MSEIEEIETMLEPVENKIDSALEKENLTEIALSNLKDMYLSLKIENANDLESQNVAKEGKRICVKLRTSTVTACKIGREKAIKEQKLWLAKEKEIVGKISEVEAHLDSEIKRIEREKKEIEAQKVQPYVEQFKFYGKVVTAMELIDKSMNTILSEIEQAKEEFLEKKRIQEQKEENERKERELAEREAKIRAFETEQAELMAREANLKLLEEQQAKLNAVQEVPVIEETKVDNSFLDEIINEEPKQQTPKQELQISYNLTVLSNIDHLSFSYLLNINDRQELYALILSYHNDIQTLANENYELKNEIQKLRNAN